MRRKFLIFLFAVMCAVCLAFGLTACGGSSAVDGGTLDGGEQGTEQTDDGDEEDNSEEDNHNDDPTDDNPADENPTDDEQSGGEISDDPTGGEISDDTADGEIIDDTEGGDGENNSEGHVHDVLYVDAVDATCTTGGNIGYWYCVECEKCFYDDACTDEITTTVYIPATWHDVTYIYPKEATCVESGNIGYWLCLNCGKYFYEESCMTELTTDVNLAPSGHSTVHTFYNEATCTADGNIEYWYCKNCGKYFSDIICTVEISGSVVIPATDHTLSHVSETSATFTNEGNIEYWHCSVCGEYFSDENCTTVISLADTVIASLGGNVSAETDYYEDDTAVTYRYSYSITTDGSEFILYIFISGSDDSYSITYKTGAIEYIEAYDVYRLKYGNGDDDEYIKFTSSGFYFCNADGTKDESKTEIEREGSGETAVDITPRSGNSSYGYYDLAYEANGADMQSLYYQMYIVCEAFVSNTDDVAEANGDYVLSNIYLGNYSLSAAEVVSVWKVFYLENPMYYWLANSCSIANGSLVLCVDELYADYSDRAAYDSEINAMVAEASSIVSQESGELDKAMAIHDYIIDKINYAYLSDGVTPETAIWAHNITGVSSKSYGVCEAYAKTYLALCLMNGLDCVIVSGYAGGEAHAWNLVKIDGTWYGVDCTWDDTGADDISYICFGMSASAIANSREADDSSEYGIDYLYELPEISETSIQLVTLYKGDVSLGLYTGIDAAFAAMTDSSAEYTIELFTYSFTGALLLSTPSVEHHIYAEQTPSVKKITIMGETNDMGNGYSFASFVYLGDYLELKCDLEIYNVTIYLTKLNLGNYTLTTTGYYCQLTGSLIYDDKTDDAYSIVTQTSYGTEFYTVLNVSYVYAVTSASMTTDAEISTFKGLFAVYGFNWIIANVVIDNYVVEEGLECGLSLTIANVTINNMYYLSSSDATVVSVNFNFDGDTMPYPTLTVGSLKINLEIQINGTVHHSVTDINGNEMESYIVSADPFNLDCPIMTLGDANGFSYIKSLYFVISYSYYEGEQKVSESYIVDYTDVFIYDNQGNVVLDVELLDGGFYVKDDVLLRYTGSDAEVVIPDGITEIREYAFYGSDTITSVTIPNSVTAIGDRAFAYCSSLESVTIGNGVESIGKSVFSRCISLTHITLPDSVKTIGNYTFASCTSLEYVVMGSGVTEIGYILFEECSALNCVYYNGTQAEWSNVGVDYNYNEVLQATDIYCYAENDGATTASGKYWYYDANGEIVTWQIA